MLFPTLSVHFSGPSALKDRRPGFALLLDVKQLSCPALTFCAGDSEESVVWGGPGLAECTLMISASLELLQLVLSENL